MEKDLKIFEEIYWQYTFQERLLRFKDELMGADTMDRSYLSTIEYFERLQRYIQYFLERIECVLEQKDIKLGLNCTLTIFDKSLKYMLNLCDKISSFYDDHLNSPCQDDALIAKLEADRMQLQDLKFNIETFW